MKGLKTAADEALSEKACDLALIRRYSRAAWRWVEAYQKGLGGVLACWAVRKSKCHRLVTDVVDREVSRMAAEQEAGRVRSASAAGSQPGTQPPAMCHMRHQTCEAKAASKSR